MTSIIEGQSVNRVGFDYSLVDRNLGKVLKDQARRIKSEIGHQTQSILATGALLIEVKPKLQHGLFTRWVEEEVGVSVRTAENYIRAAKLASECKSETISLLSPTTLYLLASIRRPIQKSAGLANEKRYRCEGIRSPNSLGTRQEK